MTEWHLFKLPNRARTVLWLAVQIHIWSEMIVRQSEAQVTIGLLVNAIRNPTFWCGADCSNR